MKPHAKFEYFWTLGMHLNRVTKFGGNLERIQIGSGPTTRCPLSTAPMLASFSPDHRPLRHLCRSAAAHVGWPLSSRAWTKWTSPSSPCLSLCHHSHHNTRRRTAHAHRRPPPPNLPVTVQAGESVRLNELFLYRQLRDRVTGQPAWRRHRTDYCLLP
jgi:hypothetical protein